MSIKDKLINFEVCYRCEKSGTNLVSPCGNDECDAKIHQKCISKIMYWFLTNEIISRTLLHVQVGKKVLSHVNHFVL